MKNLFRAASAAAIVLAAGSALAQAPSATPGAPTPAPGFGIQGGAAAAAPAAAADVNVDVIVAALGNTEAEIGKLATLPESAAIQVVDLDDYLAGADATTLNPAITAAEGQGEALRTAIQGNATILAQLDSQNVELSDVVGMGIEGANVLIFVRQSTGAADANAANAPGGAIGAPAAPAP